jgi:lysophospholipase L1-like esterase
LLIELAMYFLGLGATTSDEVWRTRGVHRPDSDLIYALRPGAVKTWRFKAFDESSQINSTGMRGDEIRARSSEEVRVLVLGDSMTYGHGVENHETWPMQLQLILDKRGGKRVEVINAAVKGYGTDQQYKYFRDRLMTLESDIVLLAVNGNDLVDNIQHPLFDLDDTGRLIDLDATDDPTYIEGRLYETLPTFVRRSRLGRFLIPAIGRVSARQRLHYQLDYESEDSRVWAARKAYVAIHQINRLTRNRGAKFVVIALPVNGWPGHRYWWLDQSIKEGIEVANLDKSSDWRRVKETHFFPEDPHFTVRGNQWMAQHAAIILEPLLE